MNPTKALPRPYRRCVVPLLASLLATSALAQSAPPATAEKPDDKAAEGQTLKLATFVTTGSSIKRTESEKVLPVTVFDQTAIDARDSTTSMDLLASIPQVTSIPANETSTNAVASRGGNANVALRGIAEQNTLVLLNGRRVPFNPISSLPATSTVNVNVLPTSGLSQVEVLRDGASAIYGADAVAGVINYITNPNLLGTSIQLRLGMTEHGGGADAKLNLSYGTKFAGDKGHWITSFSAYHRDAIYLSEREISKSGDKRSLARAPFNAEGGAYDDRTATGIYPSFRLGTAAVSGTVYWFYPTSGTTPSITTTALPRSLYADYNQYVVGQPESNRFNLYNRAEYELTSKITAFAELAGYYANSRTGRQPITLSSSDAQVTLGVDNPYNPYGSAFYSTTPTTGKITGTPQAITVTTKLLVDGGNEKVVATDAFFRTMAGLRGQIGTSTWNWESAIMLGEYRITDDAVNSVRESLLKQAALRNTADAFNPFGYTFKVVSGAVVADKPYTTPANVQDYWIDSAKRIGHSKLRSWDARVNGDVIDTWAGTISAAAGVEYRYELKSDWKPAYVSTNPENNADPIAPSGNNDILVMSPKYNYTAHRSVSSAFAETVVPLASPKNNFPLLKTLELNASIRHERYSDFGNSTNPKIGVNWRPLDWLMVRASYNEGFKAPDLTTMNQPTSFSVASPPGNRDTVRNNYFLSAGLSSDSQVLNKTYTLPTPDLGAEESEGLTAGVVIDVPFIKGLSFSVDYWEITQNNLIYAQTRDANIDAAKLLAYTQQQLAAGKSILSIDTGYRTDPNSAGTYVGDPYTLRAAVTADDIARFQATYAILPQSQWIAPVGQWLGATTQYLNGSGKAFTNGFDYEIDYSLPRTRFGQFRITTTWAQILNKYQKETPTDAAYDDIAAYDLPEWKSSTTLQWRKGRWQATLNATYTAAIATTATTTLAGYTGAGSPDYIKVVNNNGTTSYIEIGEDAWQLNLGLSYKFGHDQMSWLRDTTVRLGVNNVLDDDPPLSAGQTGYSGSLGSSLWVGRAFSLTFSREL